MKTTLYLIGPKTLDLKLYSQVFTAIITFSLLIVLPLTGQAQSEAMFINASGNVGIGTNTQTEKLEVKGNIKSDGLLVTGFQPNALVPSGVILLWHGTATQIPTGWTLCNGSNNTPDLRSRFVVGYDDRTSPPFNSNIWDRSYNRVGYTGGGIDKTLTTNNLPTHNHGGATTISGNHIHNWNGFRQKCVCAGQSGVVSTDKILSDPASPVTNDDGQHQHVINNDGQGQSFDARPPFYTLAYIMKL